MKRCSLPRFPYLRRSLDACNIHASCDQLWVADGLHLGEHLLLRDLVLQRCSFRSILFLFYIRLNRRPLEDGQVALGEIAHRLLARW